MAYTAPVFDAVNFNHIVAGYTAPAHDALDFNFLEGAIFEMVLSAAVVLAVSLSRLRTIVRQLAAAVSLASSLTQSFIFTLMLAALVVATGTVSRGYYLIVTAKAVARALRRRLISWTFEVALPIVSRTFRQMYVPLSATVSIGMASLIRAYVRVIAAAVALYARRSRVIALVRGIPFKIRSEVDKGFGRVLAASVQTVATVRRRLGLVIEVQVLIAAQAFRQLRLAFQAYLAAVARRARVVAKIRAAVTLARSALRRRMELFLASAVVTTAQFFAGVIFTVLIVAMVEVRVFYGRAYGKVLRATVACFSALQDLITGFRLDKGAVWRLGKRSTTWVARHIRPTRRG